MISQLSRSALLALACIAPVTGTAVARSVYDGSWSVLIITNSGSCDRAYRSGVLISNGYVYSEAGGINLQGRVAPNGTVRVSVSAGGQAAVGSGRLTRTTGGGVWRGNGNAGVCEGVWRADRRG
jgi:hypothetical protein